MDKLATAASITDALERYPQSDPVLQAARLAAIVETSDDAILSKTLDGTIVSWNRGATRIFGYTADEIVGRSITTLIPPALLHEEQTILERLGRGERVDHFETVRVRKDGGHVELSVTVSPIPNGLPTARSR